MSVKITIDKYDLDIIKYLYDLKKEETITTYQIAKFLFPEVMSDYKLRTKDCFVRSRLDRLAEMNIIKINRESEKAYYFLVERKCVFKESKVGNTRQPSIYLNIYNKWCSFPLDGFEDAK